MKCISVKQPFASMIIDGEKPIETRSYNTNIRGTIYIHASKKVDLSACRILKKDPKSFITGYIVGTIDLMASFRYKNAEEFKKSNHKSPYPFYEGVHGWVMLNPKAIKPIPYKGHQGWFDVK